MPYDKDLRDLLKATKKVSRTIAEGVESEAQKLRARQAEPLMKMTAIPTLRGKNRRPDKRTQPL